MVDDADDDDHDDDDDDDNDDVDGDDEMMAMKKLMMTRVMVMVMMVMEVMMMMVMMMMMTMTVIWLKGTYASFARLCYLAQGNICIFCKESCMIFCALNVFLSIECQPSLPYKVTLARHKVASRSTELSLATNWRAEVQKKSIMRLARNRA